MCKYCVHQYLRRFVRVLASYTGSVHRFARPYVRRFVIGVYYRRCIHLASALV